jgi:hypothetical protein
MKRAARPTVAFAADTDRAHGRLILETEHCQQDGGDGLFQLQVHIDHAVFQNLEGADGLPELLTLFAVLDGVRQHFSHAAHRFSADCGGSFVARLFQRRQSASLFPE